MKLKAVVVPLMVAGVFLSASTAWAQCSEDVPCPVQTIGTIEAPAEGATVTGFVRVKGFSLNMEGVSNVDLYIDDQDEASRVTPPGGANINLPRADVIQAFPHYAGTPGAFPGWEMSFKAANYSNGMHTLYVKITDVTGCCFWLEPRRVRIDNARNQAPFGAVDFPLPDASVNDNGVLQVVGWALDDRLVSHVDVFIDGLLERQAVMGVPRPDVAAYYPDALPDSQTSGFVIYIDATRLTNGVHTITVKATDSQGQQGLLAHRRFQVFTNAPNMPPFGDIEYPEKSEGPLDQSTWFGNCGFIAGGPSGDDDIRDVRYLQFISGWALDTSQVVERGGVSHISVELDGVVLKDTRGAFGTTGCRREFNLGNQLIDCYGYYRPEINMLYPGFVNAANSGFRFALDVGYLLMERGFKEGYHHIQIKAYDKEDTFTELRNIPVILECSTGNLDPPPMGYFDDPFNYELVNGIYEVRGWALDMDIVKRVQILVDGVVQIDAVTGKDYAEYNLASPEVAQVYLYYPQSAFARFRFYLDTTKLANTEHDLMLQVVDIRNNVRSAGTRHFLINNNTIDR